MRVDREVRRAVTVVERSRVEDDGGALWEMVEEGGELAMLH